MKSKTKQDKLTSYIIILGGMFFGFLLGVFLARPSLKDLPKADYQPEATQTPSIVENPLPLPEKKVSIFEENISNEKIEEETITVKWIPVKEYLKIYQNDDILSLDIRSPEEYKVGHIKASRLLPYDELDNYYKSLPNDSKVIFYANDPSFKNVKSTYKKLTDYNFENIFLLEVTYDQWKAAGNPIETGNPFEE